MGGNRASKEASFETNFTCNEASLEIDLPCYIELSETELCFDICSKTFLHGCMVAISF
jgi:hypothetical protein